MLLLIYLLAFFTYLHTYSHTYSPVLWSKPQTAASLCWCVAVQLDSEGGDVAEGAGRAANHCRSHVPVVQAARPQRRRRVYSTDNEHHRASANATTEVGLHFVTYIEGKTVTVTEAQIPLGPSRLYITPVCDTYNLKSHEYLCIITYQPDTKSNPNPTTNQHAIVNIQLNIVTCPMYTDKFVRDMLLHRTPLYIVIVNLPHDTYDGLSAS